MSIRTIIEINHDHLKEAAGVLQDLLESLPHASEREIREELIKSNAVRFVGRRHHSYDMKLVIAPSPDTPLEQSAYVDGGLREAAIGLSDALHAAECTGLELPNGVDRAWLKLSVEIEKTAQSSD